MKKRLRYFLIGFLFVFALHGCRVPGAQGTLSDPLKRTDIEWDRTSLIQLSKPTSNIGTHHFSYPRMIKLAGGNCVCVYEHNGSVAMIISTDEGASWSKEKLITTSHDNINIANPEILELADGSLILAYNLRPGPGVDGFYDPSKKFSICVKRSLDKGATWQDEQLLYEAGSDFRNGCWEPSLLQLPSGEIRLYFANEGIYLQSDEQNISMLTSVDQGVSWTKEPEIVSFARGFRDGMPAPVYDKQQHKILLAIEDNSAGGEFNPSIITLPLQGDMQIVNANGSQRNRVLKQEISNRIYAGAPYIKEFMNGTLVLSFQSTLNRGSDWRLSTMDVAIGTEPGNLHLTARPFNIPLDKSALWNALCVIDKNTVVALTSTNAFNNYSAIWMIRGKLKQQ